MIKELVQVKENVLIGDQRILEKQHKQSLQITGLEKSVYECLGKITDRVEDNDLTLWNLGNIGKIMDLIASHLLEERLYLKGNEALISKLLQSKQLKSSNYLEEGKMSTVLCGNICQAFSFLQDEDIQKRIRQIRDQIIFAMPVILNEEISVIWDESFSDIDKGDDSFWRWLISDYHEGHIFVNNASDYFKRVQVSFHVETINPNSQVVVKCENGSTILDIQKDEKDFCEELILKPGSNEIIVKYVGDLIKPSNEMEARKLQLLVGNFKVVEIKATERVEYEGEQNYIQQYPKNIAPYIMSDESIRELLHKNGFFEIKTYICSNDVCQLYRKTRAYISYGGYYDYIEKNNVVKNGGLYLYFARRRGKLDE